MKIALLHLDLSGGPQEKNIMLLCRAIKQAAKAGAQWIITPEMALQGYFFTQMGREYSLKEDITEEIQPILDLAKKRQLTIFLGCGEHDSKDKKSYNSCLVIDQAGKIIGRHRKLKIVGSTTEAWATAGTDLSCIKYDGLSIAPLVCADAWFAENGARLGQMGADLIIVIAAWPPGCGGPPETAWERCSRMSGGRPVIICNQTGTTRGMNCLIAKSAAVIDGKLQFDYQGEAAILLLDFDSLTKVFGTMEFTVLPFNFKEEI